MTDKALLHFEGADASTTITDTTGLSTWAVVAGAELDDADFRIGTSSVLFGGIGTGDQVQSTDCGNMLATSGGWTIEFFFKAASHGTGTYIIFAHTNTTSFGHGVRLQYNLGTLRAILSSNGTSPDLAQKDGSALALNEWHHIAMVRDDVDGAYYVYVNGVLDITVSTPTQIYSGLTRCRISDTAGGGQYVDGWVDELRITDTVEYPGGLSFQPPVPVSTSSLSLPVKTIVAGSDGLVQSFSIKSLLAGSDGAVNDFLLKTLLAGNNGSINTLSVKTISGTVDRADYVVSTLPLKTIIAGNAISGGTGTTGVLDLPAFTIVGASELGNGGTLSEAIPVITLEAGGNHSAYLELPSLTIAGTGLTGTLISSALSLYSLDILATGKGVRIGQAANTLPLRQMIADALAGNVNSASITLPVRRLVSDGEIYHDATATITIPALTISGIGGPNATLDSAMTLPVFTLVAGGYHPKTGVYRSWAVNLHNGALTEYQQFDFNSYTKFNGLILASDASGIHTLGTENLDNATEIDALFRTGIYGFDTSYVKRIPRLYLGYRADGTILFSTITTHDGPRTYRLPSNGNTSHHVRRVPVGKGPKSTYWQFQVENEDGADFGINSMLMTPQVIKRRSF